MRIAVYVNGKMVGWIKSVSVYRCKFYVTQNRDEAKHSYKSADEAMSDIDICMRFLSRSEQGTYNFVLDY